MRYLEVSLFFNFSVIVFNIFGIILPQNKDIELDSVQKCCSIQPVFQKFVAKKF